MFCFFYSTQAFSLFSLSRGWGRPAVFCVPSIRRPANSPAAVPTARVIYVLESSNQVPTAAYDVQAWFSKRKRRPRPSAGPTACASWSVRVEELLREQATRHQLRLSPLPALPPSPAGWRSHPRPTRRQAAAFRWRPSLVSEACSTPQSFKRPSPKPSSVCVSSVDCCLPCLFIRLFLRWPHL
jgi:hypothetical protein